ncbi:hypothetical protein JAAARDRAFT_603927 [Jaapia argillacea MUCL 33604]|uniref:non-specific serine/threonine protein kinase n=1 Tax=Jaapia argillacea MUCL 33604 TaxID=933084 RepID=A0A067PZW2_9AGAM|nr:hypothetical protein JAAARDRAFT_603927 [Jaapia argillacea MUCL 33604]
MIDTSLPPSPRLQTALIPLSTPSPPPSSTAPPEDWQPVFQASNQVVLYNPTSHALSIRKTTPQYPLVCPNCHRPFPQALHHTDHDEDEEGVGEEEEDDVGPSTHASNYFQLLATSSMDEITSRPSIPPPPPPLPALRAPSYSSSPPGSGRQGNGNGNGNGRGGGEEGISRANMADGYFARFFKEECRLGMGANGTVFLCQHVLDSHPLGHFAVKKIAVGQSHSYLLNILHEVRLLETLRHPNIITYHHAWLEMSKFSLWGLEVPTLFVLMQWAEGGSLDDLISSRTGGPTSSPAPSATSRSARIRAFKAAREERALREEGGGGGGTGKGARGGRGGWMGVHLFSAEEVGGLFGDVVGGLGFLHDKSILHLDLKPGNVLLTWDEGALIPRAMLSDFGTSRDMLQSSKARSGNTGTLEYSSPESLPSPQTGYLGQVDSKADMWSLGMILHKMLFFRLPYRYAEDGQGGTKGGVDRLEAEVLSYPGFKTTSELVTSFESRRLPKAYLFLLEKLLTPRPGGRPSCEKVLTAIHEGQVRLLQTLLCNEPEGLFVYHIPRHSPPSTSSSTHLRPYLSPSTSQPPPSRNWRVSRPRLASQRRPDHRRRLWCTFS